MRHDVAAGTISLAKVHGGDVIEALEAESLMEPYRERRGGSVLAGQAVASAVFALLGIGEGPVNDLDVFMDETKIHAVRGWRGISRVKALPRMRGYLSPYPGNDIEWPTSEPDRGRCTYRIVGTQMRGMVNEIYVAPSKRLTGVEMARNIIEGFDLNMCGVAVDLASRTLVWTAEFEAFIATREMRVAACQTPAHTVFRLLQKQRDLGHLGFVDIQSEMEILGAALLGDSRDFARVFGAPTRRKHGHNIVSEAQRESVADGRFEVIPVVKQLAKSGAAMWVAARPGTRTQTYTLVPSRALCEAIENRCGGRSAPPQRDVLAVLKLNPEHFAASFRTLYGPAPRYLRAKARWCMDATMAAQAKHEDLPAALAEALVMRGAKTLSGNLDKTHFEQLRRLYGDHPGIGQRIRLMDYQHQVALTKNVRWAARRFGRWAYGAVETCPVARIPTLCDRAAMAALVREHENALNQEIAAAALPENPLPGIEIVELRTRGALMNDGNAMRHCVGGYWNVISGGRQRVLGLRSDDGTRTTALIGLVPGALCDVFAIDQHAGFRNARPDPAHVRALNGYIRVVNRKLRMAELRSHPLRSGLRMARASALQSRQWGAQLRRWLRVTLAGGMTRKNYPSVAEWQDDFPF